MPANDNKPLNTKIYLLDNFDSFTYNLVDEFRQLGFEVVIYRNNVSADYIYEQIQSEQLPVVVVLSPGPGNPQTAGSLLDLVALCKGNYPLFGICLGHQAIVESYGGKIGLAPETVHGKLSAVDHNDHPLFDDMPGKLQVARYHSLQAIEMPEQLDVIANFGEIPMAVIHEQDKALGFQFHPESILTTRGSQLIKQSLTYLLGELS
ncbi:MAG: aminodeoxychorismate/anthranilate synthase component II [Psychrosphaera sp.]|nr:aminodeoxychorismate/anthranilate synthase component II [Psychrosphaera sp.]